MAENAQDNTFAPPRRMIVTTTRIDLETRTRFFRDVEVEVVSTDVGAPIPAWDDRPELNRIRVRTPGGIFPADSYQIEPMLIVAGSMRPVEAEVPEAGLAGAAGDVMDALGCELRVQETGGTRCETHEHFVDAEDTCPSAVAAIDAVEAWKREHGLRLTSEKP